MFIHVLSPTVAVKNNEQLSKVQIAHNIQHCICTIGISTAWHALALFLICITHTALASCRACNGSRPGHLLQLHLSNSVDGSSGGYVDDGRAEWQPRVESKGQKNGQNSTLPTGKQVNLIGQAQHSIRFICF